MKNGKNSLRQLIESTINAWCCCDTPDRERIAELEQEILDHEINDEINLKKLKNEAALLSAALIKVTATEANNVALHAENDSAYKLIQNQEMLLKITTAVAIFSVVAAAWGWLIVFGIVPI